MPLGVADYQSPEDEAEIQALMADESTGETQTPDTGVEPAVDAETTEQPANVETEEVSEASPKKGDLRPALRASRKAEERARREVERLRGEVEELRKSVKPPAPSDDGLTAEELEQAESDFPVFAKLARQNKALTEKVEALLSKQPTSFEQTADPEFVPELLPLELQEIVDNIPDLLSWHQNPDQTAYEMAKIEDQKLLIHPTWKHRSNADRLAEVTRRVNADLNEAAPKPSKPRVNVEDAIANAPRVRPNTLSDIGGGGDIPKSASNMGRYSQMPDEDIEADLLSG